MSGPDNKTPPPPAPSPRLVLGVDYYLNEDDYMVFTESYLRRRGYCCKNGCQHCPYGFKKKASR